MSDPLRQQPPWSGQGAPAGKSRTGLVVAIAAALVLLAGGIVAVATAGRSIAGTPTAGSASCVYSATPGDRVAKYVGLPDHAERTPASGTAQVTLTTNRGDIPVVLDRAKAPCAVQSFLFLATKKYFDGSPCDRLTNEPNVKVLQCGDPTGTGWDGPGYQFAVERPTGLKPAGQENKLVYPAGTVAMAPAFGANGNGSQFILVYGDTALPPTYTVLGSYQQPGQTTLDAIAAGGVNRTVVPGTTVWTTSPRVPVTIQRAAVAG
ncbi:MAG TPA: peptidylprolyl isomerase [Pseudonocardiaceae bacterium]|nr:peptidylprolyl isomerase [Pseudonocardiaceae bacterium]